MFVTLSDFFKKYKESADDGAVIDIADSAGYGFSTLFGTIGFNESWKAGNSASKSVIGRMFLALVYLRSSSCPARS
jgi:hypothetical protein